MPTPLELPLGVRVLLSAVMRVYENGLICPIIHVRIGRDGAQKRLYGL